jgi:hypothetical protein
MMSVRALRLKHIAAALLALLVGFISYKFYTSDEHERACGLYNVLSSDFSDEFTENVTVTSVGPDVTADFTKLRRWKTVCMTTMYIDSPTGPAPIDNPVDRISFSGPVGRWQCGIGRADEVFVLLIAPDDRALIRRLSIPPEIRSARRIVADYGYAHRAAGFRQCTNPQNAIARCASVTPTDPQRCLLLFRSTE